MAIPTYHFAVIGLGRRGRYHLDSLEAMSTVRAHCIAVADPRRPSAEEDVRFGPAFYRDYRDLLAQERDLSFVIVAGWTVDHTAHALAALELGIPVFLEKPVAGSWEEAVELYRCVSAQRHPLFIGYNLRRFPAVLAMKRLLDEGQVGRVQSLLAHVNTGSRWAQTVWETYLSPPEATVLVGKLTHDTDMIQHALHAEAMTCCATITGNVWPHRPDSVLHDGDTGSISGLLTDGTLYTIHLSTTGPDYERRYVVNGSEGQMDVVLHTTRPGRPAASLTLWRNGVEPRVVELPTAAGGHGGADFRIHSDFVTWLQSGPDGPEDARSILTGMVIPTAAVDSVRTGRCIDCAERLRQATLSGAGEVTWRPSARTGSRRQS